MLIVVFIFRLNKVLLVVLMNYRVVVYLIRKVWKELKEGCLLIYVWGVEYN